jgi:peroxiredoxin family protein
MAAARGGDGSLVVFLHRGSWPDRYQAVTLAVTAAALGERVTLALFFEPLRLWAEDRFDEGAPVEAGAARVASLRETLDEARRELGVAVVACDTAVRLAGPEDAAIRASLDRVVTLPQLWKTAREGTYLVI